MPTTLTPEQQASNDRMAAFAGSAGKGLLGGAALASVANLVHYLRVNAEEEKKRQDKLKDSIVVTLPSARMRGKAAEVEPVKRDVDTTTTETSVSNPAITAVKGRPTQKRKRGKYDENLSKQAATEGTSNDWITQLMLGSAGVAGGYALTHKLYTMYRKKELEKDLERAQREYFNRLTGAPPASAGIPAAKVAEDAPVEYGLPALAGAGRKVLTGGSVLTVALLTKMLMDAQDRKLERTLNEKNPPALKRIIFRTADAPPTRETAAPKKKKRSLTDPGAVAHALSPASTSGESFVTDPYRGEAEKVAQFSLDLIGAKAKEFAAEQVAGQVRKQLAAVPALAPAWGVIPEDQKTALVDSIVQGVMSGKMSVDQAVAATLKRQDIMTPITSNPAVRQALISAAGAAKGPDPLASYPETRGALGVLGKEIGTQEIQSRIMASPLGKAWPAIPPEQQAAVVSAIYTGVSQGKSPDAAVAGVLSDQTITGPIFKSPAVMRALAGAAGAPGGTAALGADAPKTMAAMSAALRGPEAMPGLRTLARDAMPNWVPKSWTDSTSTLFPYLAGTEAQFKLNPLVQSANNSQQRYNFNYGLVGENGAFNSLGRTDVKAPAGTQPHIGYQWASGDPKSPRPPPPPQPPPPPPLPSPDKPAASGARDSVDYDEVARRFLARAPVIKSGQLDDIKNILMIDVPEKTTEDTATPEAKAQTAMRRMKLVGDDPGATKFMLANREKILSALRTALETSVERQAAPIL